MRERLGHIVVCVVEDFPRHPRLRPFPPTPENPKGVAFQFQQVDMWIWLTSLVVLTPVLSLGLAKAKLGLQGFARFALS